MKSWNRFSISLRWISLSAFITLFCVLAGLFITHSLVEREIRMRMPGGPPYEHNVDIIRELTRDGMSPEVAFKKVERSRQEFKRHMPYDAYLLDEAGIVLDGSEDSSSPDLKGLKKHPVGSGKYVVYFSEHSGPPRGPPPGVFLIGAVTIAVSIIIGISLSIIFLQLYLRKKSVQAELVINDLKAGDLKARFKIDSGEQSSLLMVKFNEMAEQIESLVTNLRNAEASRKLMLQELAHDLRTPVASLKNLQELLLDKSDQLKSEERKHVQGLAIKEVLYFEKLVEDLLFLSGVNDPRYGNQFKSLDVNQIFEEEVELFQNSKIKITVHPSSGQMIQGDQHLLRRLIKNALSNGLRFASSRIDIHVTATPHAVVVAIRDDGPGLRESELNEFGEKKFSRQLRKSESDTISIGLGSVIMKKIMSLHEGGLKISNTSPGCELLLTFPRR